MRVLTIASGIIMIAAGAFCFINPGQTFLTMAFVIGTVMVICGLIHVMAYCAARRKLGRGDNNGWIGIDAMLTLLLGILVLANQLTVDSAIPMIFGMWVLISGLLRAEAASRIDRAKKKQNFKSALSTGIITIILGLFGIVNPLVTYVSVVTLLGIFMLIQGINSIELGINMPHENKIKDAVVYKKPRASVRINDELDERPEAVEERLRAQREEAKAMEFTQAVAAGNIGLTREEAQKAIEKLK